MNTFIVLCLFALAPVCTSIQCYVCTSGQTGCGDPFTASSATSYIQTTLGSGTFAVCQKAATTANAISRTGYPSTSSCIAVGWYFGIGTSCCTTDLCNGARVNYQTPILLAATLAVIFAKFQWA